MKLKKLSDYIIEQTTLYETDLTSHALENMLMNKFVKDSINYTVFMQKEFNIGSFVPCGEDGKYLTEPPIRDEEDYIDAVIDMRFKNAQDRVIFKGFEYESEYEVRNKNLTINLASNQFMIEYYNGLGGGDIPGNTLEALAFCELNLEVREEYKIWK